MRKGQKHSKESLEKISNSRKGTCLGHPFWGNRTQSEETKAKLRAVAAKRRESWPTCTCSNPSCDVTFQKSPSNPKRFCSISCAREVDSTLGARSKNRTPAKGSGRCKWYLYHSPIAGEVMLQGTWELRVARCLDAENIPWRTNHNRDRFPYVDIDLIERTYSPDFFVDGREYLEVKGHLSESAEHKIAAVRSQGVNVRVIRWEDLRKWEVRLFGKPLAGTNANKSVLALAKSIIVQE